MGPGDLHDILGEVATISDPDVIVGVSARDDAGVYRLDAQRALVMTTDFITPVCDDPYVFGQVAAANSLSDVYAMGGRPMAALAVCALPETLDAERARALMAGGAEKVAEAGAALIGGHTVKNSELFYGLAVTGTAEIAGLVRLAGLQPGDVLVLTKRLGTGLCINGARGGKLPEDRLMAVCRDMARLNRTAGELMVEHGAHAATDVTGFGLAGHLTNMMRSASATMAVRLHAAALPAHDDGLEMARQGVSSGGMRANLAAFAGLVQVVGHVAPERRDLLFDPQTSGGLLIASPREAALRLVDALHARGETDAVIIGEAKAAGEAGQRIELHE